MMILIPPPTLALVTAPHAVLIGKQFDLLCICLNYALQILQGTVALFAHSHIFMICGSPEASVYATIFKKCGVNCFCTLHRQC